MDLTEFEERADRHAEEDQESCGEDRREREGVIGLTRGAYCRGPVEKELGFNTIVELLVISPAEGVWVFDTKEV